MLGAAQFLMVLDQAVMNVAISQLVADFDTTMSTIQAGDRLYALVMAGLGGFELVISWVRSAHAREEQCLGSADLQALLNSHPTKR